MKHIAKLFSIMCAVALAGTLAACSSGASSSGAQASGSQSAQSESAASAQADGALQNGTYTVDFATDSSMFHVNEANDGKGVLTVADDGMSIHVSLVSKKIVNVYPGTADEAQADEAGVIDPTTDTVTYSDGTSEEVYGFDIPVPALDKEFDVAILGEKGTWYDHKVSVSNPVAEGDGESGSASSAAASSDDAAAATAVDELIAAIQVQKRTETTDADCKAAKDAWDALTDAQKELVEEADYFGLDTGDASKDDPLNADEIGENEILVVSFGTSFNDSRVATIGAVEKAIAAAFPDWSVRRAFTAQIIINHVQARDGEVIDNIDQALERAEANGVKNLVVAPTHLMHGAEYDEVASALAPYESKMNIVVSEPLLGEVGKDASAINEDKKIVAEALTAAAVEEAGFDSLDAAEKDGTAFVFLGHGTSHTAKVTYDQMQAQVDDLGYKNVFIGTVEGEPEDTACDAVIEKVKDAGYTKVVLRPMMVVAGDHANNDMADLEDDESWASQFTAAGFKAVDCQVLGLGQISAVQDLYVDHVNSAVNELA